MSSTARRDRLKVMSTCAVLGVLAIAGCSQPPGVVEDPETANDSGKTSGSGGRHPDSVIDTIGGESSLGRALGVAVSPDGERLHVTNQGDGTVSVIDRRH